MGIHASVLGGWPGRNGRTSSIQPVDAVDARDEGDDDDEAPTISLATPDGFIFDWLDLADAISLWEEHVR